MLDGQSHLVKQGWKGTGHPLKAGGRTRPIVIAQKKTLGGIGKDRDESFAFWDHLYDVAAKSIRLKVPGENVESDAEPAEGPLAPAFHRTETGILSNRQPTALLTPTSKSPSPHLSAGSLISRAKQAAARQSLYSKFSRGPVITQELLDYQSTDLVTAAGNQAIPTPIIPSSSRSTVPPEGTTTDCSAPLSLLDDKKSRKAEKALRKQARAERRDAKARRRIARAERKARKAIKTVRKAEKARRKIEMENRKKLETVLVPMGKESEPQPADLASASTGDKRRNKDKKRKQERT